jgi:hypothetical protein
LVGFGQRVVAAPVGHQEPRARESHQSDQAPPEQHQAAIIGLPKLEGRDSADDERAQNGDPELVVELLDAVRQDPSRIRLLAPLIQKREVRSVAQRLFGRVDYVHGQEEEILPDCNRIPGSIGARRAP